MKKFDVLVVGELNVDLILDGLSGKLPEVGKEIMAEKMIITLGSSSAIFAANLSVLGTRVSFLGKIGRDNFASLVLESLQNKKVDTSNIIQMDDEFTGITVACNYGEERAMVTYAGAMNHLTPGDITMEQLGTARHMHLSSVFYQKGLKPGLVELFRMAKKAGLTTSFDPQWDPDEKWDINLKAFLPHVDVFLPNITEIMHLTGTGSMDEAIEAISGIANIIVVKDGVKGSTLWSEGKTIRQPVFLNPEVADAIGAGDSFNAGFISRFIRNESYESCLEYASLMGALNTTRSGGTTAFTDMENVIDVAGKRFGMKIS